MAKKKVITVYKANGLSFASMDEVVTYANENGFYVCDYETITRKGYKIVLCNLKGVQ